MVGGIVCNVAVSAVLDISSAYSVVLDTLMLDGAWHPLIHTPLSVRHAKSPKIS